MNIIENILFFVLLISVVVGVHEWGHYIAARLSGVKVRRFSIGFGKPIFQRVGKNGTVWSFGWVPLGGFVEMLSVNDCEDSEAGMALENKSYLQKVFITFAGPIMNLVLGFLIFVVIGGMATSVLGPYVSIKDGSFAQELNIPQKAKITEINGVKINDFGQIGDELIAASGNSHVEIAFIPFGAKEKQVVSADLSKALFDIRNKGATGKLGFGPVLPEPQNVLEKVLSGSLADKAGLKAGDVFKEIQGVKVDSWSDVTSAINGIRQEHYDGADNGKDAAFSVAVMRGSELIKLSVSMPKEEGVVGIYPKLINAEPELRIPVDRDLQGMVSFAYKQTADGVFMFYRTIKKIVSGDMSTNVISGPISIAKTSGDMARVGVMPFLMLTAFLSINLFVFNLLPIPMFDGGQFLLHTYEAVIGRKASDRVIKVAVAVSILFIIALTGLGIFNDVSDYKTPGF